MRCVNMVCEKTASAIRLENSSDLLTVNLAALPPGASVTQNLSAIPLWRYIRLVYFAPDTSTAADALQLELAISNIRQGGRGWAESWPAAMPMPARSSTASRDSARGRSRLRR